MIPSFFRFVVLCYNLRLGKHVKGGHMTQGAP